MIALVYLSTSTPVITGHDLGRLVRMHAYAKGNHYTVSEVRIVCDSHDAATEPAEWIASCQDLRNGRFDVIVLWHADLDVPDDLTRKDITTPKAAPEGGYKRDDRVKYDDAAGAVQARVYSTARGSWDCQVLFDGETQPVTVWESDLVPE